MYVTYTHTLWLRAIEILLTNNAALAGDALQYRQNLPRQIFPCNVVYTGKFFTGDTLWEQSYNVVRRAVGVFVKYQQGLKFWVTGWHLSCPVASGSVVGRFLLQWYLKSCVIPPFGKLSALCAKQCMIEHLFKNVKSVRRRIKVDPQRCLWISFGGHTFQQRVELTNSLATTALVIRACCQRSRSIV